MLGELIILNNDKKIIARISPSFYFDYNYHTYLETGAETFDFSVVLDEDIEQVLVEKNLVLFKRNDKYKMFQIMVCKDEESYDNVIRTVESETIGLELSNDFVRELKIEGNMTTILTAVLQDTNYEIGYVSPKLDEMISYIDVKEPTAVYSVLQSLVPQFNNCELEFDVECNNSINGDYQLLVNCYANGERGNKTYKRFDYDFNAYGMSRTGDATEFCSGLIGVGANGITFKDIDWNEGESNAPLDKPAGQDFLVDPKAHEMFSNGDKYILNVYKSEATNPVDLLWETYYKLQEVKQVKYKYEIPINLTDAEYEEIETGDTCYIVNDKFNPPIQLEARISELELSDNGNKATFANYKEVKSAIKNLGSDIEVDLPKKLTQADILALRKWLDDLDIDESEIEKIIKDIIDNLEDGVTPTPDPTPKDDGDTTDIEDEENYKTIKITKIDDGVFIGDKLIYDIKKYGVANIKKQVPNPDTPTEPTDPDDDSSKKSKEYQEAVKYYKNFRLGTKTSDAGLKSVMSESNKYKIPVIVRYWCKKFGIDTRLVYAMIYQESSGNPYLDEKAYGLMQCEKSCYFGIKETIKFVDGSTKSFTPSYSTMKPGSQGKTTLNGVTVDKAISNQIMFGCNELRKRAEDCHFNIFATLISYNFGLAGMQWCVCEYIKDRYGLTVNSNKKGIVYQSSKVKAKYYEILDTKKAPFASYRQKYKNKFGKGTPTNLELYLRYYKPDNGSLPYFKDKNGKKIGYGVNTPKSGNPPREDTGSEKRDIIVKMAKTIVSEHVDQKIATYNQVPRTVRHDKPVHYRSSRSSFKSVKSNPIVYDCSSFASCCYYEAGLTSVYNKGCKAGSLVESATSKSGYKMWKCDANGIKEAKPGDLVMGCNYKVTASNCTRGNWIGWARTHHVMVYVGDGKVAHARDWKPHPNAISINNLTSLNDYKDGKMFFLRPWDLAQADKKVSKGSATGSADEIVINTGTAFKEVEVPEIVIKGLADATASDYENLPNSIIINDIKDDVKFPKTAPFVFCNFGVKDLDYTGYINLLKALQNKYPKKPIFVQKLWHVNSTYANASTVNAEIDTFNAKMENYCNKTKYVIFLDVTKDLVDSNGAILSSLSTDGYSFKDKASVKKYYLAIKKAIFKIARGQVIDSNSTTVTLTAESQKIHKYSKAVKSFNLKLPKNPDDDYYTRIIFSTDSSSIKFTQASTLYLAGDHCKKGAFTPKKSNKYIINIFKNVDTELTNKKYYGNVTSMYTSKTVRKEGQVNTSSLNVRTGASTKYKILGKLKDNTKITIISKTSNGWYKIKYKNGYGYVSGKYVDNVKDITDTTTNFTNYKNFKYRDTLVANAESFYKNKDKFVYNNTCAFDYSNPKDNISKWKTGDKIHIDDNFLMQMLVMGYSYETIDIENKTNRNKNKNASWSLPYISNEGKLLRYFVEKDWLLEDVDYDNFSNIEPGDILFWDSDEVNNDEFMACSHTSICVGKDSSGNNLIIEGNSDSTIRKIKIKDRSVNNLLAVGRINLNKS